MNKTKGSMEGSYKEAGGHHSHNSFGLIEEHTCLGSSTAYSSSSSSSWAAGRSYGCSFCKREFKSAQALGGHMNVHRRDRARLRSSWLNNHDPPPIKPHNPIPIPIPIALSRCLPSSISSTSGDKKPSRLAISSHDQNRQLKMSSSKNTIVDGLKGCALMLEEAGQHKVLKNFNINSDQHNNNIITLELGIGLLKHPNDKNKLDLELRLGH